MAADWLQKLVREGLISDDQLAEAEGLARSTGTTPDQALVKLGYVTSAELGRVQAKHFNYDYVDLTGKEIPPSVIELVPESVARENVVIPLALDGE
ncbi:MAG: GspE/PulE family protein, partial [Planctomycetaceae bacterium]